MKNKKPTLSFKKIVFTRTVLPTLKFKGSKMIFWYYWNGETYYAELNGNDLFKAIKWNKK